MEKELTVKDVLQATKKPVARDARLIFKCPSFEIEVDGKFSRLDPKKVLPFEEYSIQLKTGRRVIAKKVGYVSGTLTYFPAVQDEKGKWVADLNSQPVSEEEVEKVICDTRSGLVAKKDTLKGLWFQKLVPVETMHNWLIEDTYVIWSEDNSDSMLRIYDYLTETSQIAVFKFNPYGTTYNAFLYPQRVDGGKFRLLLSVCRVKIDKPEVAPTMVIADAKIRAKERERLDHIGTLSAIEEV
jgi:hypothetical protein